MNVKNILFDFGGVICDIDIALTEEAFRKLGMKRFDSSCKGTERDNFFSQFETGKISPETFRQTLKPFFTESIGDDAIDQAWNALLLGVPPQRISLLKKLSATTRLFLLSNTNQIHFEKYSADLRAKHGITDFHQLFEKAYFSHQICLRKPFPETFLFVLNDAGIKAEETLFIDDSIEHVEAAKKLGILAYHLQGNEKITDLFSPSMQFLPKELT